MRRASAKVAERNAAILDWIRELKAEHSFWGYRRVWAHLRFIDGLCVNRKRILRLMREAGLIVQPNMRLKATRMPSRPKPRPTRPNEWWGIDMTKVLAWGFSWLYIVIVLDWHTKKVVGYDVGERSKSTDWPRAVDMAVNRQFPEGARDKGLSLMSDNGCQPTSVAFMEACSVLGIRQAFTSYGNPKGNADTERMMRTIKEELLWLNEWTSAAELKEALGYRTPERFETEYKNSRDTLLATA